MDIRHTPNLDPGGLWSRLEASIALAGLAAISGLFACIAGLLAEARLLTNLGLGLHLAAVAYILGAGLILLDRRRSGRG